MLPGGYVAGGWTYFFFQNLAAQSKLKAAVDFQLNEADVNRPWDLVLGEEKSYSWFNYDTFEAARNPLEDQHEEFLSIDLRVSPMKRAISVKYNTIDEFFGDIGGSWEFAIIMGFILYSCLSSLRCLSIFREVRRWFLKVSFRCVCTLELLRSRGDRALVRRERAERVSRRDFDYLTFSHTS